MDRRIASRLVLALFTAAALYACFLLFRPYLTPILFASVVAIVFYPLHRRIRVSLRNASASALASTLITILLIVVPLTFLLLAITNEVTGLYQSLAARSAEAGGIMPYFLHASERLNSWAHRRFSLPALDVRGLLLSRLETASAYLLRFSGSLVSNTLALVVNAVIALIVLFFLFRDGERFIARLMEFIPMAPDRTSELQTRITSTVRTNFYSSFVIGTLQGTLTGITFWALGIESPVLWGIVTAFFSLIPFVGTAAVWVPAAVVLLLTGHVVKGLILLGVGAGVIGTVDNIVRPLLVHKGVPLHPILLFFSFLGGVSLLGPLGLFVGPVIVSVTAALLEMFKQDMVSDSK